MKREQEMKQNDGFAMKMWLYISKPFQITKVLEILYALNWIWYAVIATVPDKYISGGIFTALESLISKPIIIIALFIVALLHSYALWFNAIWLRKVNLMFNIAILLYLSSRYLLTLPIPAGVGYLVILIGVSVFAYWRMDETH